MEKLKYETVVYFFPFPFCGAASAASSAAAAASSALIVLV